MSRRESASPPVHMLKQSAAMLRVEQHLGTAVVLHMTPAEPQ